MNRYTNLILWLAALAAFHMAWTAHDAAAFNLNGFDLAEQVTVHPAIRAESPTLRTSMLLWSAIPIIAAGIALNAVTFENRILRWLLYGLAGLVSLRVIPPEVALRSPRLMLDSPHDRALAILTALGLIAVGVMILLRTYALRFGPRIEIGLVVLGLALPLIGWERGIRLLDELQLDVSIGGGVLIYAVVLLAVPALMMMGRLNAHDPGRLASSGVAVEQVRQES